MHEQCICSCVLVSICCLLKIEIYLEQDKVARDQAEEDSREENVLEDTAVSCQTGTRWRGAASDIAVLGLQDQEAAII